MQNAMFSALFGALSNEHRLNSIANNLANVNSTGYKRDMLAFKDTFMMYAHDEIIEPVTNLRAKRMFPEPQHLARVRLAESQTDFTQGALKATGAPFDLAISGQGFFKLLTPQGEMYTRNGNFRLTAEGTLISGTGYPILGTGGTITIPEGYSKIIVAEDGRIFADGTLVDQLSLVSVDEPHFLEKTGSNLYKARKNAPITELEAPGFIVHGFLEAANVDAVYEMVNMIEAQRQFEAYAKVMQTSETVDKEAIQKIGRVR